MRRTKSKPADLAAFQSGRQVLVTRDDGTQEIREVRHEPERLGNGRWVVWLRGLGCFDLNRCQPTNKE
jgi:hypothetical protein